MEPICKLVTMVVVRQGHIRLQIFLIARLCLQIRDHNARRRLMVDHLLATTQVVQQAQLVVDQMIIMANLETILLQDLKLKLAN